MAENGPVRMVFSIKDGLSTLPAASFMDLNANTIAPWFNFNETMINQFFQIFLLEHFPVITKSPP